MRRSGRLAASRASGLALCLLAGCGGGGGGAGGGIAVVPGAPAAPTSTPTPTPTPTPSPAASPTPSPVYDTAFDFSRDRSFRTVGARLSVVRPKGPGALQIEATLQPNDGAILIAYASANRTIAFRYDQDQSTVAGGPTVDDGSQIGWSQGFTPTIREEFVTLVRFGPAFRYVLYGGFDTRTDETPPGAVESVRRAIVAGSPTLASDLPTTGAVGFVPVLVSASQGQDRIRLFIETGNPSLRVDFASRTVTATIPYTENGYDPAVTPERGTLSFTGTLNAVTNAITGAITSPDSGWTGSFTGKLFGPAGAEIGLAFTLARSSDGARGVGQLGGRR